MKLDDIYKELKQFAEFNIPNDALASGHARCIELLQEIRKGQDYCTFYINLCYEQLSKCRQTLMVRERAVKLKIQESTIAKKHSDIKGYQERAALIKLEAENEANVSEAEEAVMKLDNLKDALENTLSNLRSAKEQLNLAFKVAQLDWEIAKSGTGSPKINADDINL